MKKITVILSALLLSAAVMSGCAGNNTENPANGEIENNPSVQTPENQEPADNDASIYKQLYIDTVTELNGRYEDTEWSYGLVDINGDEVPELVANYPVCVSLYTVADGELHIVMEEVSYGAAGNNGYSYLPGKNVILNYDNDMAGAVVYETYCKIGETNELENYHAKPLYTSIWKDANGDGLPDDNEISDTTYYFYGKEELTEEEYNKYRFGDGFEGLCGEMTFDEIIAELNK